MGFQVTQHNRVCSSGIITCEESVSPSIASIRDLHTEIDCMANCGMHNSLKIRHIGKVLSHNRWCKKPSTVPIAHRGVVFTCNDLISISKEKAVKQDVHTIRGFVNSGAFCSTAVNVRSSTEPTGCLIDSAYHAISLLKLFPCKNAAALLAASTPVI